VWGTQPLWTVVLRAIKEKDNRNKTKVKSIKGYENDRRSFIVKNWVMMVQSSFILFLKLIG